MEYTDIQKFATLLERKGFKGPMFLVENDLIPLAEKMNCSLFQAAKQFANPNTGPYTRQTQLFDAMRKIEAGEYPPAVLEIYT